MLRFADSFKLLLARHVSFFVREEKFQHSDEHWFARSAHIYSTIGALVAGFYSVFYWTLGAYGASISLGLLVIVCIATLPLHLLGKSQLLAKINLGAASMSLAGVVAHMGGIDSSAACWLLGVTPGITALLFRRAKEIAQFTSFTLALYALIFVWELQGHNVYEFQYPEGSTFERIYTAVHFVGFSIFIAVALAIFATTQRKLLNDVERQARDVKAILSTIHQGIFTIVSPEMKLGTDFSKYVEAIVGTNKIASSTLSELILSRSNLSTDQKDMIENIVASCVNETPLNFTANEDNLAREISLKSESGTEKQLLLDWQPIINEKMDTIEKILVTMLDVTEMRKVEQQNKQQRQDIEIILEINAVEPEKFDKFMRSAESFLNENERLSQAESSLDNLKILFINMHTLKGIARTFRMKHLTSAMHDCEHYYAEVQRSAKPWSSQEALSWLRSVRIALAHYDNISKNTLKRVSVTNKVSIDLDVIKKNINLLQQLESYNIDETLTPFVQSARSTFYSLYFIDCQLVFDEIFLSLPALAKDLGKASPKVNLKTVDTGVTGDGAELLKNTFVHLLRNSMDHGIESPEERQKVGKAAHGEICIEVSVADCGSLQIKLWDDGRGLALDRIHAKGIEQSLISPDTTDPQTVAHLIFHPGLSTAKSVSDISGRGIGMSAVREFFEKAGGSIEVHLPSESRNLKATPFEFIIMIPPTFFKIYEPERHVA